MTNMKPLFEKAFVAYTTMLNIHINTKTMDRDFHEATESFYETLFDCAHKIGEKHVDLGGRLSNEMLEQEKKLALQTIKDFKQEIEKFNTENDVTLGTEDLLGSLANDLESTQGTASGYVKK